MRLSDTSSHRGGSKRGSLSLRPRSAPRAIAPGEECAFRRAGSSGFTLVEVLLAVSIVTIGFLGAFAIVLQSGKLISAAEEDGLVCSGLEQRMDQLRALPWGDLTDGTGLTGQVWTSRPEPLSEIAVSQETMTISPYDVPTARTLQGTWTGTSAPTVTFTAAAQPLSAARAVKVVATLSWVGRRSARLQTRSLVTVISEGGISKSVIP